eukprot:1161067-Pelagomonas_calceolata.AAC.6
MVYAAYVVIVQPVLMVKVSAAIASRSGLNVYNIVMAMDRWLALNPTCYLGACKTSAEPHLLV